MSDMPAEEFRQAAHDAVDWIADYLEHIRDLPVLPLIEPGHLTAKLPDSAPETGEPIDAIMQDFRRLIVPANTHWNHPRFHAYFSVSASGPGIIAEALTAALNVNGMLWKSSPAATELEQVTLGWLRQWLQLPDSFFGIIHDTASLSTLHALAAAREMKDPESRVHGASRNLTVYTSEQAHSSVEKGAIALGFGQENVRKVGVDEAFRMRPDALEIAIQSDIQNGKIPCCVVPTVGTTGTTSIDPIAAVGALAAKYDLWMHVDAAFGGPAAILPELRHILNGAETAHSIVINPHKWMFTPIDCSVLYVSRPDILRSAFSLVPEYLRTSTDGEAVNLMDYGVALGRRFRALKLWFVMRYFGREGIASIIRNHIAWTQSLAEQVANHPSFEVSAPVPLSLLCFRYKGTNEQNRKLLQLVNESGVAFLSHTVLNGQFVLRLAVGNIRTNEDDLQDVWLTIQGKALAL